MELSEVKPVMAKRRPVTCDGITYIVTGCILRIREADRRKVWYYQLELADECGHSVTIADMKNVEIPEVSECNT